MGIKTEVAVEILDKNLAFIKQANEALYSKITSLTEITKSYEICTNLSGQYNLLIDGKPVHSITDVDSETQDLITNLPERSVDTLHFIYGIGLGYLPDKFVEETKGLVIVYEQDIESLYFVLSAVDFSESFKTNRLFFISSSDELLTILGALFKYKSKATLSVLDYYNLYHKTNVDEFRILLRTRVDMQSHNITFLTRCNFEFFQKTVQNIHKKYEHFLITDYKDAFKDVPAIIASAGPSLSKNIELLKKYQNNALIFCGGTSLNTLYQNAVIPDFLNVIERNNTKVHYDLPITDKINFITEPFTDSSYFEKDFKRIFYTAGLETEDSRWFLENAGKDLVPFETKGTVAYHSLYTAYYLGCNPIILIGQDLAYSDGNCYTKGSVFDGLACVYNNNKQKYEVVFTDYEKYKNAFFNSAPDTPEETKKMIINARLNDLNANLRSVQGQNGEKLPTDAVYELFLHYIQDFASIHKSERMLINSSIGGALINGFATMPLNDAIEKYAPKVLDKTGIIDAVEYKNTFDKNKILACLKHDYDFINGMVDNLNKAFDVVVKIKKCLQTTKLVTPQILELYKKLCMFYYDLQTNCIQKSRIGRIIVFKLYMELDYLIRTQEKSVTLTHLNEFVHVCDDCISNALKRIDYVKEYLSASISEMENNNESSYSKGK